MIQELLLEMLILERIEYFDVPDKRIASFMTLEP